MRTTLNLDDALIARAKARAATRGTTLTRFIEDALRAAMARPHGKRAAREFLMPTYGSGGVRPGVDLDDNGSLADLMGEPPQHAAH